MNIYIFENHQARDLDPISLTHPVFEIRSGAFTCIDRLTRLFPRDNFNFIVRPDMSDLVKELFPNFKVNPDIIKDGLWLLGNVLWEKEDVEKIVEQDSTLFYNGDTFLGTILTADQGNKWMENGGPVRQPINSEKRKDNIQSFPIRYVWEAVQQSGNQMEKDFGYFSDYSHPNSTITMVNKNKIFAHASSIIGPKVVIDATLGPVFIEKNVTIKPMVYLEGPLYIGEGCVINPFTQITDGSSIGPFCKLGGEINRSVIQGWSNKVHDGHLGDSYLGKWVNLGAGTCNSNLKNNYSNIDVMVNGTMTKTGSKHVGCFLGDHVKTAIGTRLNTGTIIGTGSNIVTKGFPPKTINPFSWCVKEKIRSIRWEAFIETARIVEKRRGIEMSSAEESLLKQIVNENEYAGDIT